jgi:hypothetical protein
LVTNQTKSSIIKIKPSLKVDVLFFSDLNFWGKKIRDEGVTVIPVFKKIPSLLKPLRIFHLNNHLPFKKVWYNHWESELKNFDLIILTAGNFTVDVANYIESLILKKNIRLIFWYWDPVRMKYAPDKISNKWEKWSFDKEDCKNFDLKYNSTYFFNSIKLPNARLLNDVFFIGQDKGRLQELLQLKDILENFALKIYFHIIADKKFFYNRKVFRERISYSEVLRNIKESKAILEFVQEKQSGLTLRSMEALFFNKKLITTNDSIKNYDLYCKENIFILGHDDINSIQHFLNSPCKTLDKSLISKYDFNQWLQRMINNIGIDCR